MITDNPVHDIENTYYRFLCVHEVDDSASKLCRLDGRSSVTLPSLCVLPEKPTWRSAHDACYRFTEHGKVRHAWQLMFFSDDLRLQLQCGMEDVQESTKRWRTDGFDLAVDVARQAPPSLKISELDTHKAFGEIRSCYCHRNAIYDHRTLDPKDVLVSIRVELSPAHT